MAGRDVIVMGGSAGGIEALMRLVPTLPRDLPAAIAVTVHLAANSPSNLPALLSSRGPLRARFARDGDRPTDREIFVARPDHHLVFDDGALRLTRGPHENGHRPAIDALFRSAARSFGPRVIGVVLSGSRYDGTAGLFAIRREGGVAVVQDPEDAAFSEMPRSAMDEAGADHVARIAEMAPLLARLAAEPARPRSRPLRPRPPAPSATKPSPSHSPFICPHCGGTLDEIDGEPVEFRCQVGHRYSGAALEQAQAEKLETGLWVSLRVLVEHARLSRRLEARARARGHDASATRFALRAAAAEERARLVREALRSYGPGARPAGDGETFAGAGRE